MLSLSRERPIVSDEKHDFANPGVRGSRSRVHASGDQRASAAPKEHRVRSVRRYTHLRNQARDGTPTLLSVNEFCRACEEAPTPLSRPVIDAVAAAQGVVNVLDLILSTFQSEGAAPMLLRPATLLDRSTGGARRQGHIRRRLLRLEGLEDRCLLSGISSITEFPFRGVAFGRCPTSDHDRSRRQPLVHRARRQRDREDQPDDPAISEFAIPTANANPTGSRRAPTATSGSPRRGTNKIGMINPTTHAISEFALPTGSTSPGASRRAPTATSGSPRASATRSARSTRPPTPSASSRSPTRQSRPERDHGGPRRQPLVHRGRMRASR